MFLLPQAGLVTTFSHAPLILRPPKSFTSPSLHCPSYPSRAQWNPLACTPFPELIYKEALSLLLFSISTLFPSLGLSGCVYLRVERTNGVEVVSEGTEGYKVVPMVRIWEWCGENSDKGEDGWEGSSSGASIDPDSFSTILLYVCRHELDWI